MLLELGKWLFTPQIQPEQLGYRSEVLVQTSVNGTHRADFVLAVIDDTLPTVSARRVLVEIQGGGETNNTGYITRHIQRWGASDAPNNELLSNVISGAGTIETNAWRRMQEQLFAKATTAAKTGYGFAIVTGEVVFNYVKRMLPDVQDADLGQAGKWDIALLVFEEVETPPSTLLESINLKISRHLSVFLSIDDLFELIKNRGHIDERAFSGEFISLDGSITELLP